jgi:hypothetical protein
MVKNRSQKDINDGMSLADAARGEMNYFSNHSHFGVLVNNDATVAARFGIKNLTTHLTKLLVRRIKDELPTMKAEVRCLCAAYICARSKDCVSDDAMHAPQVESKLRTAESKLEDMPLAAPSTPQEKYTVSIGIAREYDALISQLSNGKYSSELILKSSDEAKMRLFTRIHDASCALHASIAELVCTSLRHHPQFTRFQLTAHSTDLKGALRRNPTSSTRTSLSTWRRKSWRCAGASSLAS